MRAGIAAPISLLEECAARGHYHVALAHLVLKSETYRDFYLRMSKRGDYVIVDNGVVETGEAMSVDEVVEAAEAVDAAEIILPDVIGEGARTAMEVSKALRHLNGSNRFGLMAVCQGKTVVDFLATYIFFSGLNQLRCLGLTMFLDMTLGHAGGRVALMKGLLDQWNIRSKIHDHHLLGCWSDLREFRLLRLSWIRSMDTGVPVRLGLKGIKHPDLGAQAAPSFGHRDFDFEADFEMNPAVDYNISLCMRLCGEDQV